MKAKSTFSLKDQLFNADRVSHLAALIERAHPVFPGDAFRRAVMEAFPSLELKQRIAHITVMLHVYLPREYRAALHVIMRALPPELDPTRSDDDYGDFIFAPLSLFVAKYGCTEEHLDVSLDALREITKRFSAEDAVRYFINAFPLRTLGFLRECARDDHYHVRRLASEGTRPLLPWSQRLTIDYREPLPILDVLFADRTRYVTRSVANHVNDISKLDAALAVETIARWRALDVQAPAEIQYITKHALRTLVRHGRAEALALVGFEPGPDFDVVELTTSTPRVRLGDAFRFSVKLRAGTRQRLLVDYRMTYAGQRRDARRKVFRLKQVELDAAESVTLTKAHPMRLMTTRRLQPGEHTVTLRVNGRAVGELAFTLEID